MPTARMPWIARRRHFIVCGDNPLAHRLADQLRTRPGTEVTVILQSKRRNHGPHISRLAGVHVIEAQDLTGDVFREAHVETAAALALVGQNDVGNMHAAMRATDINPELRLVLRMFDLALGQRIRLLFNDCVVLSDSALAAPWFVADALNELAPIHVRLPGRTLRIARRPEVEPGSVVCGLAATDADGTVLLPADEDSADLVLADPEGAPIDPLSGYRQHARLRDVLHRLRSLADRKLEVFAWSVLGLLIAVTAVLAIIGHYSWPTAAYLTLLDAAGAAQPAPHDSAGEKAAQVIVTVVGISLIPLATAAVVDAVVGGRLAAAFGRLRGPVRDHVVVVGLGNVGSRVVEQLHDLRVPVVCIETNRDARGVPLARRLGVPVIFGDVNEEETLRAASTETCRSLLALTSDDMTNLRAALSARELRADLRVVLRLFDGDFAARVQRNFDIATSRSVSFLSVPSFAVAMLERQVIDTIAVGRQVLLIAEIRVAEGSELDRRPLDTVPQLGEVRVLGLLPRGGSTVDWEAPGDRRLEVDDRLLVVATKDGLTQVVTGSIATVDAGA